MKYEHGRKMIFIIGLCLLCMRVFAQGRATVLQYSAVDQPLEMRQKVHLQDSFPSVSACLAYVKQLPAQLQLQGYLSASVDSVHSRQDTIFVAVFLGEKYRWKFLHIQKQDLDIVQESGLDRAKFDGQNFSLEKVNQLQQSILDAYLNHGYPFAKVQLDSVVLHEEEISAVLKFEKGGFYSIDSIAIIGNARLSQNFIHRYLDIAKHEAYSTAKLERIDALMRELPYVEQVKAWDLTMSATGGMITLYLKNKSSSQVDAVVGFLPENQELGGKMLVTGQVNILLQNAFSAGETIGVNWQQLQARSPRLKLNFIRPYLFNSPYGLTTDFELYKKDSLFMNVNAKIGVNYAISTRQSGAVFVQFASTRLLDVDTAQIISSHKLPDIIDVGSTSLGLQYQLNTTNYRFNPRSGNELSIVASAGQKTISKNNTITSIQDPLFDYNKLYDSLQLKSYQYRIVANGSHYFPVGRQAVFKSGANMGIFQSPNSFNNEMFQLGGFRLLRGFDEESIYASKYAVFTEEYRYLIGQNAFFFVFSDLGWAQYQSRTTQFAHKYIGLGAGMSFQTKNGLLNINYAVGKRDDTKLDMQQAKINIGFTSFF